jgi:hypothetical protein
MYNILQRGQEIEGSWALAIAKIMPLLKSGAVRAQDQAIANSHFRRLTGSTAEDGTVVCRDVPQREDALDRKRRRASKIWLRLGGEPDTNDFPPKPTGMWWRTYDRLCKRASEAETLLDEAFAEYVFR